jgi:hypothetical protein
VKAALLHPKGAGLSDNQIAEHVGVSRTFVGKLRKEMEGDGRLATVASRTGADGRTRDTTNIGRSKAVEEALAKVPEEKRAAMLVWTRSTPSPPHHRRVGPLPTLLIHRGLIGGNR